MHWRVMTYNIHHGADVDGKAALARQAALIANLGPDLVALQEVDRFLPRSRMRDQARLLAAAGGMEFVFSANLRWLGFMQYGNAVLSRRPFGGYKHLPLPDRGEKRGLLVARIDGEREPVFFLCVHLGLDHRDRRRQLSIIRRTVAALNGPVILAGDFNTTPGSGELDLLGELLRPAALRLPTFPSDRPRFPLDNVFYSPHWRTTAVSTPLSTASDHLPLLVNLCRSD